MQINSECFKIKSSIIERVKYGKLAIEDFALLIGPSDPFVLVGDTVYVFTEDEYYASKQPRDISASVDSIFDNVMKATDLSYMSEADIKFIETVKIELPTCRACTYNKYKRAIVEIANKYNETNTVILSEYKKYIKPYPEVTEQVNQNIPYSYIEQTAKNNINYSERKACIDCVEKHVSQAYILANETVMGYPEHFSLVCAHLDEAIAEMPPEAEDFRDALILCKSISIKNCRPFIPIYPLISYIDLIRNSIKYGEQITTASEAATTLELNFTDAMKKELEGLPEERRNRLIALLLTAQNAIITYKSNKSTAIRMAFEGAVASAADDICAVCPTFGNMLRNRRILFKADLSIAQDAGYSFSDVLIYLDDIKKQQSL